MINTVIVGGGIAGLTIAEELAKRDIPVVLLERYRAFGGRVVTNRDPVQYEIGAGRIATTHTRVRALVDRFRLHTVPIDMHTVYRGDGETAEEEENAFYSLFEPLRQIISALPASILRKHTIAELVISPFADILRMYPYWSEIHVLRADLALAAFAPKAPLGGRATYYGIAEGLDSITTQLAAAATRAGADLRNRHRVEDVVQQRDGRFRIVGSAGKKADARPFELYADRVIFAVDASAMRKFRLLESAPFLRHLRMCPLIRIYAIYPPAAGSDRVWFHDMHKTVTPSPLRYVIPIDYAKGLIMISYTDGDDCAYWRDLEGDALRTSIGRHVHALWGTHIPEPTYLEKHVWNDGTTYWCPGEYDLDATISSAHNPIKNVYVCGESISRNQAWIEGALESAEELLPRLLPPAT